MISTRHSPAGLNIGLIMAASRSVSCRRTVFRRRASSFFLRAAAGELGLDLTADQIDALLRFNELLQRWNAVYNLTSVRDATAALTLHVVDCLAAVPALRRQLALADRRSLLDVGSGGGLPGVVFASPILRWR